MKNPTNANSFRTAKAAMTDAVLAPAKKVCVVKSGSRFLVNYGKEAVALSKQPGVKVLYKDGF